MRCFWCSLIRLGAVYRNTKYTITAADADLNGVGPTLRKLYERVRKIQVGEEEDTFGWMRTIQSPPAALGPSC